MKETNLLEIPADDVGRYNNANFRVVSLLRELVMSTDTADIIRVTVMSADVDTLYGLLSAVLSSRDYDFQDALGINDGSLVRKEGGDEACQSITVKEIRVSN